MSDPAKPAQGDNSGLPYAIGAFTLWGLTPIYFKWLAAVPVLEVVGHRALWSAVFLIALLGFQGQLAALGPVFRNRRLLGQLTLSGVLIGTNWLIFVWAIAHGQIIAASLAYYLAPLANVLLGRIFLGERPTGPQRIAVLFAVAGVAILAFDSLDTLWISLFLAINFSSYGLIRRQTAVSSVHGLTVETLILLVPGIFLVGYYGFASAPPGFGDDAWLSFMLIFAAVAIAVPLLMFATAARRMRFSALGFTQFITPTMTFLLGVFVYDEPFGSIRLLSFVMIWAGVILFARDAWRTRHDEVATVRDQPAAVAVDSNRSGPPIA